MLVLNRKLNERIFINGGDVKITVVDIGHGRCRLGFEADESVSIRREEVPPRERKGEE